MSDQIPPDERPSLDESAPPIAEPNKKRQYWLGVAYGTIPLLVSLLGGVLARSMLLGVGPILGAIATAIAYIVLLAITIAYLLRPERRFMGYGFLTMLLITPVISVYGCLLIFQSAFV